MLHKSFPIALENVTNIKSLMKNLLTSTIEEHKRKKKTCQNLLRKPQKALLLSPREGKSNFGEIVKNSTLTPSIRV